MGVSSPRSSSARRAGRRHPSTSSRTPAVSFPRASSLDHSPPPSRNVDPTPSPPTGWGNYGAGSSCGGQIAGFFCEFVKDHMFNMTKSSVSQGIPSTPTPCIPRRRGPKLCPHRRSLTERRLAQPASLSLKPGSPPSRGCTDAGGVYVAPVHKRPASDAHGPEGPVAALVAMSAPDPLRTLAGWLMLRQ